MSDCIRGCTRPCRCEECRATDAPVHDPQPVVAEKDAQMCRRCNENLRGWLDTVLMDTATLDPRIPTDYGWDKEGGHHKVTGSPALVRLEVAALTDGRNTTRTPNRATQYYEENQDEDPSPDIPGTVMSWARMWTEERVLTTPVNHMAAAVDLLARWWDELIAQPWIDDLYTDMRCIRQHLDRAHSVERPKPVGHCLSVIRNPDGGYASCGRALYQDQNAKGIAIAKCGGCGRVYRGLDLVRAQAAERPRVS